MHVRHIRHDFSMQSHYTKTIPFPLHLLLLFNMCYSCLHLLILFNSLEYSFQWDRQETALTFADQNVPAGKPRQTRIV